MTLTLEQKKALETLVTVACSLAAAHGFIAGNEVQLWISIGGAILAFVYGFFDNKKTGATIQSLKQEVQTLSVK